MVQPSDVRKAKKLAREECACNYSGECVLLDCDCVIQNSGISLSEGTILCKYFSESVLPSDPQLQYIFKRDSDRFVVCAICEKAFVPTGNRQKYCTACRSIQRKKQQAKWRRENQS